MPTVATTPDLSHETLSLINQRYALNTLMEGPRIGDYVDFPDGHRERVAHDHDYFEAVQTAKGGSYYLGEGFIEHSGALNPMILKRHLTLVPRTAPLALFWVFRDNVRRAGNAVDFFVPVRVYRYDPKD